MGLLKPFTESRACASRRDCVTCRDKEGGRAWRAQKREAFALPNDDVDFDCPHGVAWGESTAPAAQVPARVFQPVPRNQWPDWADGIAELRDYDDIGVGTTIHRCLGEGGLMFKATLKALGAPCGCDRRQAEFDAKFPY